MIRPSLQTGAALCWARALGEFGATITFAGNFPARLCVDLRVDAIKPRLLLLDEPLSALDIRTRAELRRHLESFRGVRCRKGRRGTCGAPA